MDDKEIQNWILVEEAKGRRIDEDQLNERLQVMITRHNNTPRSDLNGLSPKEMHEIVHHSFDHQRVVSLNNLKEGQYEKIPLVRQAIFILKALNETELKLTKLGWLPLKFVAEAYPIGQPEYIIEELKPKRITEFDAKSVWMARVILDLLGWVKTRKGKLSITVKGRKALCNVDDAANEILHFSLSGVGLNTFDGNEDDRIGNTGMAYSVWLLNKFGSVWHSDNFYQEHYSKVFDYPDAYNTYATRVFPRLFYWLGIVEKRFKTHACSTSLSEYRKTNLFPLVFSMRQS